MAFDFKTATPDTTVSSSAYLLGADSQAASNPSIYLVSDVLGYRRLTADTTFYVRTDGSNSNNGLANTSGGAWLTIQYACDQMANIDANGYGVTIQVADGTYSPAVPGNYCVSILYRPRNAKYFWILGNTATPANVVVDGLGGSPYGFQVGTNYVTGAVLTVLIDRLDGFKVKDAYSYVSINGRSKVNITNCASDNNYIVIEATDYSYVFMGSLAFSGTSNNFCFADGYSSLGLTSATFAVGSVINGDVFTLSAYNYLGAVSNNYTNLTVSGSKYVVGPFCYLNTSGASATIPGTAGTVDALGKVA
jgi:hypothetical protein